MRDAIVHVRVSEGVKEELNYLADLMECSQGEAIAKMVNHIRCLVAVANDSREDAEMRARFRHMFHMATGYNIKED